MGFGMEFFAVWASTTVAFTTITTAAASAGDFAGPAAIPLIAIFMLGPCLAATGSMRAWQKSRATPGIAIAFTFALSVLVGWSIPIMWQDSALWSLGFFTALFLSALGAGFWTSSPRIAVTAALATAIVLAMPTGLAAGNDRAGALTLLLAVVGGALTGGLALDVAQGLARVRQNGAHKWGSDPKTAHVTPRGRT